MKRKFKSDLHIGDEVTHYPEGYGYGTCPADGVVTGFVVNGPHGRRVLVSFDGREPDEIDPEELG